MPIGPYLKGGVFDPEDIQTMSMAVGEACRVLRISAGAAREIRIIELARRGELEYRRLVERCLKDRLGATFTPYRVRGCRPVFSVDPSLPHPRPCQHQPRLIPAAVLIVHAEATRTKTALVSGCSARSAARKHLAARSQYAGALTLLIPPEPETPWRGFRSLAI